MFNCLQYKTKFKMPCFFFNTFGGGTLSIDSAKLKHRESNVVLAAEFKLSQNSTMTTPEKPIF